jgi:hypothetical protein
VRGVLLLLALAAFVAAGATSAAPLPQAPACQVFPKSNAWNQRVDSFPVARNSDAVVASIGVDDHVHADFGSGLWEGSGIGIPITVVSKKTPRTRVSFEYASESDRGPYPIPSNVKIEGGGDRHAILVDKDSCTLYELFALERRGGRWHAGSGAIFDLRSNKLRPRGWTSADAAGLAMLPGLARYDEVARGRIDHALRFTVSRSRRSYVWPARHFASSDTSASLPPMGLRLRLKASYDISGLRGQARAIGVALKTYGALVADNAGSPRVYVGGAVDAGWDDEALNGIKTIPASALEAVQTGAVVRP